MSEIVNLTNPGQEPIAGDLVRVIHSANSWEEKFFTPNIEVDAPVVTPRLTQLAFLRRMTQAERIAFRQAAKVDPVMEDFMDLLDLAQDVDLKDPDVIAGLQAAEAAGLLAAGRAAEILA